MPYARNPVFSTPRYCRRQGVVSFATLSKPDIVHMALRLDVDRTVAYGKPNGLHTTLRRCVAGTAWRAYDVRLYAIWFPLRDGPVDVKA